jgi:hypothetical protein
MQQFISIGFECILNSQNDCPYTGKEKIKRSRNKNIKIYCDEFGSERYVYYLDGKPVSALQLVNDGKIVRSCNVITVEEHRRKGFARQIWNEAKRFHPIIIHSTNLSEDGKIYVQHCK